MPAAGICDELASEVFDGLSTSTRTVYALLRIDGPLTRGELAAAVGVCADTITTATQQLKDRDLVGQRPAPKGTNAHYQYHTMLPRS